VAKGEGVPIGLQARKLLVMQDVSGVAKDADNVAQKYKYASAAGVFGTLRPALLKHGLTLSVSCREITTSEKESKTGGLIYNRVAHLEVTLYDVESGEREVTMIMGEGQDSGDKSLNKAYTVGLKYWALMTFFLPQGYEDPEADPNTDRDPGSRRTAATPSSRGATEALWKRVSALLAPGVLSLYREAGLTTKGAVCRHYQEHGGRQQEIVDDLTERIELKQESSAFQQNGDEEAASHMRAIVAEVKDDEIPLDEEAG